ncbi:IS110 family transposase [Leucobacter triazinivorans]|uniref:IS110 family transposase n=1 Tax=Leucobacter triazinivorans TaxID=1784719 RepID=A0A4P6KCU5_9MICO|nr:IS110 family transposase [Leucobacter triazinivorans]QBE48012.1 IS110 family transposase [Leucobacter triazinivorans]QBE49169.1 IS110 family transposase [Leucobacter triazinivorans]
MTIVAHQHPYVIGVDTHARTHTYAVLSPLGELLDIAQFPTTTAGMQRAISWGARRTGGDLDTLWVIEGTASYGARLVMLVASTGYEVVEAPVTPGRVRAGKGKSDPFDARQIAAAALPLQEIELRRPRAGHGYRLALRVLLTARDDLTHEHTQKMNALTALLRVHDLGIDARRPLTRTQVAQIAKWRCRSEEIALQIARAEAVRLAKRLSELALEIRSNQDQIHTLLQATPASELLEITGIGPIGAAVIYTAWSHQGRVRSEASFAALAGVSPVPASSGNTVRHRLNRGGDRRVNRALHLAAVTRARCDEETKAYIAKRTAQGRTPKEIRRCLKRYLARRVYKILNAATTPPTPN